MKTMNNSKGMKKRLENPFDKALIRLGQHITPQQACLVLVSVPKKR